MALTQKQRRAFIENNRGFFQGVKKLLRECGKDYSTSTLSRTFYSLFQAPSQDILRELDSEYLRVQRETCERRRSVV